MAFDWFRRRFNEQSPTPTPAPVPDPAPTDPTPEATDAMDYLAFAKAAYANIKSRQDPEPTATEPDTKSAQDPSPKTEAPTGEQSDEPTDKRTDDQAEAASGTDSQTQDPELPAVAQTGVTEAIPSQISGHETVTAEATIPEPPTQDPGRPTAFFDIAPRATQRLEALEATAVEDIVVETEPTAAETPDEAELAFDEGFRWSAEILAAQGRRADDISVEEITWLQKLRQGLGKTRLNLINQLKSLVGRGPIDQDAVEEIEAVLLQADVGFDATENIIKALQARMKKEVLPPDEAVKYLKEQMRNMLTLGHPTFAPERDELNIWLIVGVNGAGKTTTIGKISHLASKSEYKVLIAAADTFRAAAVEQLKIWGERSGVEVVANQGKNTDPAAVVFDAIAAAQARQAELLLVDTAGRLQNKKNLMDELSKIRRVIEKKAPKAKVESLLVLDATLGQNGLQQAKVFGEAAKLSGVVLTKLDSTAKGGIAFAITQQMKLPIRFIGAGEGLEDLRPFSSYEFVEALISEY